METFTEGETAYDRLIATPEKFYEPMPDPVEAPEEKTFSSDADGLRAAAREFTQRDDELDSAPQAPQESESPITEREYSNNDPDQTIKIDRAARDLTAVRDGEAAEADALLKQTVADVVDGTRSMPSDDSVRDALLQSQAAPQVEAQPPSVPQQTQSGLSPEVEQALANPEVRAAIQKEIEPALQARQQYVDAVAQSAEIVRQQLLAEFPYLANLSPEQRPVAIELLKTRDPAEFQRVTAHLQRAEAIYGRHVQAQQQMQQQRAAQYQQDWQEYVKREDAKLFEAAPELVDRETQRKTADGMVSVLREAGFADRDLKAALEGRASISLQDHRAQLLIRDAWRYRQAMRFEPVRNVPTVQRPGVSQPRGAADDVRLNGLRNRLNQTGNAKDAAALLIAQRAARR